ncbi:MAG: polyamine ABC transporter ATP-binding protein [Variovorax paradoxus]|nr:MAG: polyamine ABC transporter ATP-binding protein [Variovorax paradoxus]PZP98369.1 MAG: polyamine ABC transporter ATP-binding protein [Variovorax paradoxus]
MSLTVAGGEFVTLLGPSGSGKSTLLGLAVGSIEADRGSVEIRGRDVRRMRPHERNIGMVFQRYSLFPNKTVAENIAYPLVIRKVARDEIASRVASSLATMNLTRQANRYPSEISGGQAQRVAVARALVFSPDLLLMDEPLGALDKSLRAGLQEEIRRLQRASGVPTLYVTHDQDEAMYLSDRIALCNHGRIVVLGAPRELYEEPGSQWEATFLGEANILPVKGWTREGAGVQASLSIGARVTAKAKATLDPDGQAALMIRPEYVHVGDSVTPAMSTLSATITDIVFLGPRQRVSMELADGTAMIADLRPWERPGVPGDSVSCGWNDHHSRLVEA